MKNILSIYSSNKELVDNFIYTVIGRLNIEKLDKDEAKELYKVAGHCVKLVYSVDDNYILNSPYYLKNREDNSKIGVSKKYYFSKVKFSNRGEALSTPYLSSYNGQINITYVKRIKNSYLVVDIDIVSVLERLKLIKSNQLLRNINNYAYGFMGFSLVFFALFLGFYSIITFVQSIFDLAIFDLGNIFKSIVALTLGLAIFDLGKTILEHEIFYKSISHSEGEDNKILSKFLISIIIALSIEALMVVFKIALNDYTDMFYGFLLIIGVSTMIYAVGKYNNLTKK